MSAAGTGHAVQWLVRRATSGAGVSEGPEGDRASPQWARGRLT